MVFLDLERRNQNEKYSRISNNYWNIYCFRRINILEFFINNKEIIKMTNEYDGEYSKQETLKEVTCRNISPTTSDLISQVGSSCQYSGRCANHSDKCSQINYRDTCTVKDDFTFGWHGVGL